MVYHLLCSIQLPKYRASLHLHICPPLVSMTMVLFGVSEQPPRCTRT